jgi:hypothetical protein
MEKGFKLPLFQDWISMFNRFGGCNKWNINVFVGGKAELASENKFQSWHVAQKKREEMLELTGSDSRGVWNSPTYLLTESMYVHTCAYMCIFTLQTSYLAMGNHRRNSSIIDLLLDCPASDIRLLEDSHI